MTWGKGKINSSSTSDIQKDKNGKRKPEPTRVSVVLGETGIDDREINTMKSLEKTDMTSRESFTSPGPDNSVHSNDKAAYKKKKKA